MSKPRVLVFSCVAPLPNDRGDRVRVFHMLTLLRRYAEVRLVCLERTWEPPVRNWEPCADIELKSIPVTKHEVVIQGVRALLSGKPYLAYRFAVPRVMNIVRQELSAYKPDIFWSYGIYAYPFLTFGGQVKRVLDLADSPSLYTLMSRTARTVPLTSRLQSIVQWNLLDVEDRALKESDHVIVCSQPNAEHLRRTHSHTSHVTVLPNSVPSSMLDSPWSLQQAQSQRILFVGNLAYPPNAAGVRSFVQQIWPQIRAASPNTEFAVVGRVPELLRNEFASQPGVLLMGFVDDLSAVYRSSRVMVVPVEFASGVQTKLIEAMAIGVPAVVSPASARANGVTHGQHVLVGESPAEFAEAVLTLLQDDALAQRLSHTSRQFVSDHHTWEGQAPKLNALLVTA
jgi:polysaccharide biosynthesis protein PslH